MSAMMDCFGPDSLALAEQSLAGFCADGEFFERAPVDREGFVFFPPLPPPPPLPPRRAKEGGSIWPRQ